MAIQVLSDTLPNSSDKSIKMDLGFDFRLVAGSVRYTSTATVTDRQIQLIITDVDGNTLYRVVAPSTQAPSLTYIYSFGGGIPSVSVVDNVVNFPIPTNFIIGPNWKVRIVDTNVVDLTGDDMDMFFLVEKV